MLTIGNISLALSIVFVIISVVFYIKDDIGRASFWLLAAILSVLMLGG